MKKYITLLVLFFLLFLSGCDKRGTNTVTNNKISSNEIRKTMVSIGVTTPNSFVSDVIYSLPSENWIKSEFSSALSSFLSSFKSGTWVSEENDCDNFASMAFSFAQILHHNTPQKLNNTALAFGEVWYTKDDGFIGHAINVVIVYESEGKFKTLFYEPQTQQIVKLSENEIQNVMFYRF